MSETAEYRPRSYRTEIVSRDGTVLVSRRVIATSLAHAAARAWDVSADKGAIAVAEGGRVVKDGKAYDVTVDVKLDEE